MALKIHLFVIDPQVDFMDSPGSALPVPGANADMRRLSAMIDRVGAKLEDIHVTLDSHRVIDVGHPGMWRNKKGENPSPFTIITADDIEAGIWRPRNEHAKLAGGITLGQDMLEYARTLAKQGNYPLMVWPEHCLIGTPGHAVQPELMASLQRWERKEFANVNFVTKGVNFRREHYGALMAEVVDPSDPSTGLNTGLLDTISEADIVALTGEALSHCVKTTVTQIADNIGADQIGKFIILTDCTSSVPAIPNGPDFPAIGKEWLKEMKKRGMKLTTSTEFLA